MFPRTAKKETTDASRSRQEPHEQAGLFRRVFRLVFDAFELVVVDLAIALLAHHERGILIGRHGDTYEYYMVGILGSNALGKDFILVSGFVAWKLKCTMPGSRVWSSSELQSADCPT